MADELVGARADTRLAVERAVAAERRATAAEGRVAVCEELVSAAEDTAQRAQRDRALTNDTVDSLQASSLNESPAVARDSGP